MQRSYYKLTAFWLTVIIFVSACNKEDLNLLPMSESEAGFYKDDDQFFMAITGAYAKNEIE